MLRHSPPLPLSVSYHECPAHPFTPEDEEGALLALRKHDRVRHIDLCVPLASLDKIVAVMDGSFPLLEVLTLSVDRGHSGTDEGEYDSYPFNDHARLSQAFQAPQLRYLDLNRVRDVTELNLPLLASLSGLISLTLIGVPFSVFLSIEYLASRLSLMPLLECLGLGFDSYFPSDDPGIEAEPIAAQNVEQIHLPNLSEIFFKGTSSYLEALSAQISAPLLKTFTAQLFDNPSSSLPHLSHLLSVAAELRLPVASIKFSEDGVDDPNVVICMACSEYTLNWWPNFIPFQISFHCESLSEQVTSTGQICASLSPMLSAVERLHINLDEGPWQREEPFHYIEDDAWQDLFRPFSNVKKLQIDDGLIEDLAIALYANDNGSSMEILPELCKLVRPDYGRFMDSFDDLITERRDAGRHITKRRRLRTRRSPREKEADASEDEKEGDESDGEEDGDESEDREVLERDVEDEDEGKGKEARARADDADDDPDSGSNDDSGFSTELDSDTDFDFECTFNLRRSRFALYA
jgi:hypothetical protein